MFKNCNTHGLVEWKECSTGSGKPRVYRCISCIRKRQMTCRRKKKERLVRECGGQCQLCGYNRWMSGLQFHHLDPKTKKFGISSVIGARSYERCLEEARICVLLCGNCHTEIETGCAETAVRFLALQQ